jgi:hypothetical protein
MLKYRPHARSLPRKHPAVEGMEDVRFESPERRAVRSTTDLSPQRGSRAVARPDRGGRKGDHGLAVLRHDISGADPELKPAPGHHVDCGGIAPARPGGGSCCCIQGCRLGGWWSRAPPRPERVQLRTTTPRSDRDQADVVAQSLNPAGVLGKLSRRGCRSHARSKAERMRHSPTL